MYARQLSYSFLFLMYGYNGCEMIFHKPYFKYFLILLRFWLIFVHDPQLNPDFPKLVKLVISLLLLKLFKCTLFRKKIHEYAKQDNFKRRMLSHFSCFFATLWTVACQAPLSMGFSRQKYWSALLCPSPGNLPDPGIEPRNQF